MAHISSRPQQAEFDEPDVVTPIGAGGGYCTNLPPSRPDAVAGATFSALEQVVIAIGARDPVDVGRPRGNSERLFNLFVHPTRPLPLANTRLEALRHIVAVLASGKDAMIFEAAEAAMREGYSSGQLQQLFEDFARRCRYCQRTEARCTCLVSSDPGSLPESERKPPIQE